MVLFFKVHSASYMKDEFWGRDWILRSGRTIIEFIIL